MGRSLRKRKGIAKKITQISPPHRRDPSRIGTARGCGKETEARNCFEQAMCALQEGQLTGAIALFEEAARLDPHMVEAWIKAGYCCERLKNYEKAMEFYEKALEIDPSRTDIHYSLGVSLQLLGLPKEAELEYRKVVEADPTHVMARNNLAAVYLKEGKSARAIDEFKKLVECEPHNELFKRNLTVASVQDTDGHKGRKALKQGISLCMVMRDEGEEVSEFLRLTGSWVDEIVVVAAGECSEGIREARRVGAKIVSHTWGDDLSRTRNTTLTHAECEWILVLDSDEYINKEGFSYLRSLITQHQYEGFRFVQRNYIDNPSFSGWVPCTDSTRHTWNCCGWIPSNPVKLFKNCEHISFEGVLGEVIDRSILRGGGKIGKANILVHHLEHLLPVEKKRTREQEMVRMAERQRSLTPGDPHACYRLALSYVQLGELDRALTVFEELVELLPNNCSACNDLASLYCAKKEYQRAKDLYQRCIQAEPRFFQAHYNLANLYLMAGELKSAWDSYQEALSIHPECAHIYSNLVIICEKRGDDEEAFKQCERALSLNPFLPEGYNNLGVLYSRKDKRAEAEKNFLKAIALRSEYAEAYHNLGQVYLSNGERDKAEKMFEKARGDAYPASEWRGSVSV